MAKDFLPTKDLDLLNWSGDFSSYITAHAVAVGLTVGQASAYAALHSTFATCLANATNPLTRTVQTIELKQQAKAPLKAEARDLARVINAFPAITNEQRV